MCNSISRSNTQNVRSKHNSNKHSSINHIKTIFSNSNLCRLNSSNSKPSQFNNSRSHSPNHYPHSSQNNSPRNRPEYSL